MLPADHATEFNALNYKSPIQIPRSHDAPARTQGYAFNRTRTTYLATDLLIARTHWSRFRGLMATDSSHFSRGQGLWINPSHGIHTFAMRFPIDAVYLDRERLSSTLKRS